MCFWNSQKTAEGACTVQESGFKNYHYVPGCCQNASLKAFNLELLQAQSQQPPEPQP